MWKGNGVFNKQTNNALMHMIDNAKFERRIPINSKIQELITTVFLGQKNALKRFDD